MKKTKTLRRRCENEACRKLYRHADPRAAFCSQACKQRVYRARKKAAAQAEQEQGEAKLHGKYAHMLEQSAERERQVEAERQPPPAPRPRAAPSPPASTPWPYTHISRPEPTPQTVTIRYRKPYVTPI